MSDRRVKPSPQWPQPLAGSSSSSPSSTQRSQPSTGPSSPPSSSSSSFASSSLRQPAKSTQNQSPSSSSVSSFTTFSSSFGSQSSTSQPIIGNGDEQQTDQLSIIVPTVARTVHPIAPNQSTQILFSDIKEIVRMYTTSKKADKLSDVQIQGTPDNIQVVRPIKEIFLYLKNEANLKHYKVYHPQPDALDVVIERRNRRIELEPKQFNDLLKKSGFGQFKLPDPKKTRIQQSERKSNNQQQQPPPTTKDVFLLETLNFGHNCGIENSNETHEYHMNCTKSIGYRCMWEGCYRFFKLKCKPYALWHIKRHHLNNDPSGDPTKYLAKVCEPVEKRQISNADRIDLQVKSDFEPRSENELPTCSKCNVSFRSYDLLSEHCKQGHQSMINATMESNDDENFRQTTNIVKEGTNPISLTTNIECVQQTEQTALSNQNGARKRPMQIDHDDYDYHFRETSTNIRSTSSSSGNVSQPHDDNTVHQLVSKGKFTRSKASKIRKTDDNVEPTESIRKLDPFCFKCHLRVVVEPRSCTQCPRTYHRDCARSAKVFEIQQLALDRYQTWKDRSDHDAGIETLNENVDVCDECVLPIVGELFHRVNNEANKATLEEDMKASFLTFSSFLIEFCETKVGCGYSMIINRAALGHKTKSPIISPIDLSTINSKAAKAKYKSIDHFMRDIKLLIHNRHIKANEKKDENQKNEIKVSLEKLMKVAQDEARLYHMCYSCRILFHMELDQFKPPEIYPTVEETPYGVMFQIPCPYLHAVVWAQIEGVWFPAKVYQHYIEGSFEVEVDTVQVVTFGPQHILVVQLSDLYHYSKRAPGDSRIEPISRIVQLAVQEAKSYLTKIDREWYAKLPELARKFDGELYMDPPQGEKKLKKGYWKCANCPKVLGPKDKRLESRTLVYCSMKCKDAFLGRV